MAFKPGPSALPVALPCPECRYKRQAGGQARIGNERRFCSTCNRFAATVRQRAGKALIDAFPDEFARLRRQIETDIYPGVVERWLSEHPEVLGEGGAS